MLRLLIKAFMVNLREKISVGFIKLDFNPFFNQLKIWHLSNVSFLRSDKYQTSKIIAIDSPSNLFSCHENFHSKQEFNFGIRNDFYQKLISMFFYLSNVYCIALSVILIN